MKSQVTHSFGERLREERRLLGLNQQEFGTLGGVAKPTQIGYEADTRTPDLHYLAQLTKAGVDPMRILTGKPVEHFAAERMNWDLVVTIFDAVSEWESENDVRIDPNKRSALLQVLYKQFAETREINPTLLASTLKLAA